MKVNNAVILAAGNSTRFAPLSYEMPKGLIEVRGEVLIERQIRQLKTAGIEDISIVTGYMHENYEYLAHKYDVRTILNPEYKQKNNISSIWAAREIFKNTYVCFVFITKIMDFIHIPVILTVKPVKSFTPCAGSFVVISRSDIR